MPALATLDPLIRAHRKSHPGRWVAAGLASLLVVLLVAARLALTPFVAHQTRRALNSQPHLSGDFDDLSLSVLKLRYRLKGLELHMNTPGQPPVDSKVESVDARLRWGELFHLRPVADVRVDHIKAVAVLETEAEIKEMNRQIVAFAERRHLGSDLEELPAFRLGRLELRDLDITIADHTETGVSAKSAQIWIHGIQATLENLADRAALLGGRPTTLALKGELQRSGALTIFLTADPLADRLDFASEITLRHLDLRELYGFIASQTKLQAEGSVDAFVKLKLHDAQLEGQIKPVIENLHLAPAAPGLKQQLEATLANAGAGVASDRVPGRNGLATVIPISGPVSAPKVDLWPALLVLLHSAYQAALAADFSHEPAAPAGAKPQEGKVGQVTDAVTKKQFPAVPAPAVSATSGGQP